MDATDTAPLKWQTHAALLSYWLCYFLCRQCVHIKGVKLLQCELVLLDIETVVRERARDRNDFSWIFILISTYKETYLDLHVCKHCELWSLTYVDTYTLWVTITVMQLFKPKQTNFVSLRKQTENLQMKKLTYRQNCSSTFSKSMTFCKHLYILFTIFLGTLMK